MAKIAFIGAGSLGFAQRLIIDVLNFPALRDAHFSLMDIDAKRLDYTRRIGERIISEQKLAAKISVTTNQAEAVTDADFVIIAILSHGFEPIQAEYDIPLKHGVDQCIGDTLGPGGVFRTLRTSPMINSICRDVLEHAKPDAWILNYTNPMAMLTWAAYREFPGINFVGLCHSVQGTTQLLADKINVPYEDVRYWVAGINHMAWVLNFKHKDGTDLYPRLRDELPKSDIYDKNKEMVRIEMMKHLGYFVTESSGHNSEYNPWFRKRKDLIEKYTGETWSGETGYILKLYGTDRENYEEELEKTVSQKDPIKFDQSVEYGSAIINAIYTNLPATINGNVRNNGLITNLRQGACVEVPCLINAHGVNPCFVGDLPTQCAALNRTNINVQELTVQALAEKSREHVYHALYHDPLTAAKLSLAEIRAMVDEMLEFENSKNWLPELK